MLSIMWGNVNAMNQRMSSAGGVVDANYVKAHPDDRLVDVRTVPEYDEGHIPGALNIVYDPMGVATPAQTAAAYAAAGIGPDDSVILYCRSGARAQHVAGLLRQAGFTNVKVYAGSWIDWASNPANPVARG